MFSNLNIVGAEKDKEGCSLLAGRHLNVATYLLVLKTILILLVSILPTKWVCNIPPSNEGQQSYPLLGSGPMTRAG